MFTAKEVEGAIEAMASGDGTAALEILKRLLVAAATTGSYPGGAPPPAADMPTEESAETPPDEETVAAKALARVLMTLSRTESCGAVETWVKQLAADRAKVDADRAALEADERRALVTELVTLRAETPATAWERDAEGNVPEGDKRKPCARLMSESLESIRERVAALRPAQPAGSVRVRIAGRDP